MNFAAMIALATVCGVNADSRVSLHVPMPTEEPRRDALVRRLEPRGWGASGRRDIAQLDAWSRKRRRSAQRKRGRR